MKKKGRGHFESGEVTAVAERHGDGKHVHVTVKHGKRTPPPKPKKGESMGAFPAGYDDRRETTFAIPKHKAKHYPVGKKVRAGLLPIGDNDGDEGEGDTDDDLFGGKGV